jgi:hypothetical protein
MITRDDATPLPILDRFELVKTAIGMIDEGMEVLIEDTLSDDNDLSYADVRREMEHMRADSYISMFGTMVNSEDEAKMIVRLLRMEGRM